VTGEQGTALYKASAICATEQSACLCLSALQSGRGCVAPSADTGACCHRNPPSFHNADTSNQISKKVIPPYGTGKDQGIPIIRIAGKTYTGTIGAL
jgi:hypothetical protein